MTLPAMLPFLSDEHNVDDPSCYLADFRAPKLRQFPKPPNSLRWKCFLGAGENGFVISAKTVTRSMVAVKFFYHNAQPEPLSGLRRYWAFRRECLNAALLCMIKAAIQRATEPGQSIYLNPETKTIRDAVENLEAFAADCLSEGSPLRLNREPLDVNTQINHCFGWTRMPRGDVFTALSRASKRRDQFPQKGRVYADLDENESCFAIVYSFVPEEKLDAGVVQRQLDFFHVAGFNLAPFREQNWRGEGILVDISDLIPPRDGGWWRQGDYQRMNVGGYIADLEEREEAMRRKFEEIQRKQKETPKRYPQLPASQ